MSVCLINGSKLELPLWQRGGDSRGVAFGRIAAIKIICILAIKTIKKRLNCSGLSLLVIAVQPFF